MTKQWYEKYIGYCFSDNGKEVILQDIFIYEDGKKGYELYYPATKETCMTDYKVFKQITKQTVLPK